MGEQPGFMGIGKFEVDVYYNDIKHRMNTVRIKIRKRLENKENFTDKEEKEWVQDNFTCRIYISRKKTTLFNIMTGETRELE